MHTTKTIYTTAANIGYLEGLRKGKPFGVVNKEILQEGNLLHAIYALVENMTKDDTKTNKLKKMFLSYKKQRAIYDEVLEEFTSSQVFLKKDNP